MKQSTSGDADNLVVLGRISGVHGVRGWIKVFSYTEPKENIFSYQPWQITGSGQTQSIRVAQHGINGKKLIARIEECDSREYAQTLIGADILVPEGMLEDLHDGDYYWRQLRGLQVVNLDGEILGVVTELLETGANDVLVVQPGKPGKPGKPGESSKPVLIPWVTDKVVRSVDLDEEKIIVDWQAGW